MHSSTKYTKNEPPMERTTRLEVGVEGKSRQNPKDEIRNPKEDRNPKSEWIAPRAWFRASAFGFASDFGLRISDFPCNAFQGKPTTSVSCCSCVSWFEFPSLG